MHGPPNPGTLSLGVRLRGWTLTLLGFGALIPASAWATGPSRITPIELDWMVREIVPVVEEVGGRRFATIPEVVMADESDLAEVIYQEQVHLLSRYKQMTEEQARDSAHRTSTDVAHVFAGKYGFLDKKLYLSVEGIRLSLGEQGAPAWMLRPMVRLVVAHELAHALQDQVADLDSMVGQARGGDAIMAVNCTVEGHAVWVHEQVATRMGLHEAVVLMSDMLGYDEPIRRRMDPDHFYTAYVYGLGRDFVAWHQAHGGTEQVWDLLDEPPSGTAMIAAPETWTGDGQAGALSPKARQAIGRARRLLAGKGWRDDEFIMGDFNVRDQLVRAGANTALADDLQSGWNLRSIGGDMLGVEIQLLRFQSESGAAAYVEDMKRHAYKQSHAVASDPFIHAEATPFDLVANDNSARETILVKFNEDMYQTLGTLWIARGPDVVQVILVNVLPPDKRLARAVDQVFVGVQSD